MTAGVTGQVTDDRSARAAWSRVSEPGDLALGALVGSLGAFEAWQWLVEYAPLAGDQQSGAGPGPIDRPWVAPLRRWARRLSRAAAEQDLQAHARQGGSVVIPGDVGWPSRLDDLGLEAPLCLWVRGRHDLAAVLSTPVSVVGARACTDYGVRVAGQLAVDLGDRGHTIVSGGAYGIDAAAHRGALAAGTPTVVFLAGGTDRLYPAGNARMFEEVLGAGGVVVSEAPPGAIPARSRFLLRNRLIAAVAGATVVVEAARRSGALATAHRASALLRPVGAVPGPVTSLSSAGCHELLRSGEAVCVTSAADVCELIEPLTENGPRQDPSPRTDDEALVRGSLSARVPRSGERLTHLTGLTIEAVQGALGSLELRAEARRAPGGWLRTPG